MPVQPYPGTLIAGYQNLRDQRVTIIETFNPVRSYTHKGQDIRIAGVDDRKSAHRKRFSAHVSKRCAGTIKGVKDWVLVIGNFCFNICRAIIRNDNHLGSAFVDTFLGPYRAKNDTSGF
jgi:hypothetical protein